MIILLFKISFLVIISGNTSHLHDGHSLLKSTEANSSTFFHGSAALVDLGLLVFEVTRSHSETPHSSGRVISSSQRPLPDNTQH
jgi:hypothetical protein